MTFCFLQVFLSWGRFLKDRRFKTLEEFLWVVLSGLHLLQFIWNSVPQPFINSSSLLTLFFYVLCRLLVPWSPIYVTLGAFKGPWETLNTNLGQWFLTASPHVCLCIWLCSKPWEYSGITLLSLYSRIIPGRLWGPYGCQGLNTGWPCARHVSSMLHYSSSPWSTFPKAEWKSLI